MREVRWQLPRRLLWPHLVEGRQGLLDLLGELRHVGDLALTEVLALDRSALPLDAAEISQNGLAVAAGLPTRRFTTAEHG